MMPVQPLMMKTSQAAYRVLRPLLFRRSAEDAHEAVLSLLSKADQSPASKSLANFLHHSTFYHRPLQVGGVHLQHPMILAAGFVKGTGFPDEATALAAVERDVNIMPGWRTIPALVGHVEFGSFTRYPRMGNQGAVMWRDVQTQSTQNRIGLKNPGVIAAASFLQKHIIDLPYIFGINIAVSPGIEDTDQQIQEIEESLHAFLNRHIVPNWFTLNISCPNTEDDPTGNQTRETTERLCRVAVQAIHHAGYDTPLWVKVGPDLSDEQYRILMQVFEQTGVRAVVATNTLGMPTPDHPRLTAGMGGGKLYPHALKVASLLQMEKNQCGYSVDVIGCGGIVTGDEYLRYKAVGIQAVQYWSAMVYRGPLAAAYIESERS